MALPDLPRVVQIPRSGSAEGAFILLHVSSLGQHALDLKLIGTDNEEAFSAQGNDNSFGQLVVPSAAEGP